MIILRKESVRGEKWYRTTCHLCVDMISVPRYVCCISSTEYTYISSVVGFEEESIRCITYYSVSDECMSSYIYVCRSSCIRNKSIVQSILSWYFHASIPTCRVGFIGDTNIVRSCGSFVCDLLEGWCSCRIVYPFCIEISITLFDEFLSCCTTSRDSFSVTPLWSCQYLFLIRSKVIKT